MDHSRSPKLTGGFGGEDGLKLQGAGDGDLPGLSLKLGAADGALPDEKPLSLQGIDGGGGGGLSLDGSAGLSLDCGGLMFDSGGGGGLSLANGRRASEGEDLYIDVDVAGANSLPSCGREESFEHGAGTVDDADNDGHGEGVGPGVSVRVCHCERLEKLWFGGWQPEYAGFAGARGVVVRLTGQTAFVRFRDQLPEPLHNHRALSFAQRALLCIDPPPADPAATLQDGGTARQ